MNVNDFAYEFFRFILLTLCAVFLLLSDGADLYRLHVHGDVVEGELVGLSRSEGTCDYKGCPYYYRFKLASGQPFSIRVPEGRHGDRSGFYHLTQGKTYTVFRDPRDPEVFSVLSFSLFNLHLSLLLSLVLILLALRTAQQLRKHFHDVET